MDLTEHLISTEDLAKGDFLCVKRDQVRLPNGNVSQREYVTHPGAVVIVPLLSNGNIVLERQFRYPLHKVFIELPAGKIDANESTLHTGQRELLEETGYQAKNWVKLGEQHPCIGYSNEVIHIYLARDLTDGLCHRDDDEALEVFDLALSDAIKLIQQGDITDSKTIVALFLTEKYIQQHG
ncbi:NUDIX domain-containing protein [Methylotenera sp. L2L1]|uniref:NUDIX domain-containing protein n=1 Tax=Methylotenera sp. L2L1 TaxID=1502770 RepID=UPI00055B1B75|nr:NUDIX hydrolase [Methylotenera sp. L2L1]